MRNPKLARFGGVLTLAVVMVAPIFVTAGCSDKPSCKLLYKRLDKCEDDFALKEDKFIKMCKKRKDKARVKEQIKCSKHSDCDKFKKCLKEARKKAAIARLKKRIKEAFEEKKYSRALMTCKFRKDDLNDELKKKCKEIAEKAYGELSKKAIKMRDEGPAKGRYKLCSNLKTAAKAIGEAKVKEAEELCKAIDLAKQARKAIEKAAEYAKKDRIRFPYNCNYALKKLAKNKGDFAKKLAKKVKKACYVDLGIALLKQQIPKIKRICPYQVRNLKKAIKKYNVSDPKLKAQMEKLPDVCKK